MKYFPVFNYLDEPKKYSGVTLLEMIVVGLIVFIAFILQYLAAGLLLGLMAFRVVRTVSRSPKVNYYKRALYFHYQDLKSGSKGSRFYL
jgi:hypothetical protein